MGDALNGDCAIQDARDCGKKELVVSIPTMEETAKRNVEALQSEEEVVVIGEKGDKLTSPEEKLEWRRREAELLKRISELESARNKSVVSGLKVQLKERDDEMELLKTRVKNLETQLQVAMTAMPGDGNKQQFADTIKQQHDELLNKARGMIFDKSKVIKNQELQIEALTTQVHSLKDINQITKDLLEIRNSEIKAMEERYSALESRFKGEKERFELLIKRAQVSSAINKDVKKEYDTQMSIFKELRGQYELKVQALITENNRLKEARNQLASS